mmetsp:Transcript_51862/g.168586  ORF Transcript_51862/g.168586 Transcript_51862/m.168586 type:complete len:276 (+) Transcript_51862:975-1802(+)
MLPLPVPRLVGVQGRQLMVNHLCNPRRHKWVAAKKACSSCRPGQEEVPRPKNLTARPRCCWRPPVGNPQKKGQKELGWLTAMFLLAQWHPPQHLLQLLQLRCLQEAFAWCMLTWWMAPAANMSGAGVVRNWNAPPRVSFQGQHGYRTRWKHLLQGYLRLRRLGHRRLHQHILQQRSGLTFQLARPKKMSDHLHCHTSEVEVTQPLWSMLCRNSAGCLHLGCLWGRLLDDSWVRVRLKGSLVSIFSVQQGHTVLGSTLLVFVPSVRVPHRLPLGDT